MGEYEQVLEKAIIKMVTEIPPDVFAALKIAAGKEKQEIAKKQFETIIKSISLSHSGSLPLCQDTGLLTVFLNGKYVVDYNIIREDLYRIVIKLTKSGKIRPSLVNAISRVPIEGNVGFGQPEIYLGMEKEDSIKMMLKGAGSENYSTLEMFLPSVDMHEINRFILKKTLDAGGKICPPSIVSVSIGGSPAAAVIESRKALFAKIGVRNKDKDVAVWEKRLLKALNALNIGPMGLGGKTGVLDVKISVLGTHIAMLPVALTYNCWALRRIQIRRVQGKEVILW
jgi:fumarate hydratase subunit alpha